MHNLAVNLERNAALNGSRPALKFSDNVIEYQQLNNMAGKVAAHLKQLGLEPGDKVAISCPNTYHFPLVYYGILKAGCVVVPLNVLLKAREIEYHLNDSDAKAYFCFDGNEALPIGNSGREGFKGAPVCEHFIALSGANHPQEHHLDTWLSSDSQPLESVACAGDDSAVILYTSGTTGQPKGAELTHSNMHINAMNSLNLMALEQADTTIATLPLFHSFGQTVMMNATLLVGGCMVLVPRFEPRMVINEIITHRVSIFAGVPTMYIALLSESKLHPEESEQVKNSLRLGVSGGSSLPVEVIREFERQFELPILEGYGLSETAPVATFNYLDSDRLPGSVGQPLLGHAIKVVDLQCQSVPTGELGEVWIRSPSVMKGYYNRPEATREVLCDGWFRSGDIGRLDDNQNLFIVDRLKDMIIRGGYNVYPREIEELMICHPSVEMVAVVANRDARLGEEIHAHVTLTHSHHIEEGELIAWCRSQLADYKYPRRIFIRESLPMTATGKILKRQLHPVEAEEGV